MSRFLETVDIERYGAFRNRKVGPFAEGLNVVFGPNEAGKSTIASFVGGVLFGWDETHGVNNTYTPAEGDRAGTLSFSNGSTIGRAGDEGVLSGDTSIVSDLDGETFRTMFSLTSDELRSLRSSSDVTARLLAAGSGTESSPASAFVEIEQRIAALTSRADDAEGSIFNLASQLDDERALAKAAGEEAEQRKREDRELRALVEDRAITARHLADVNHELEKLGACHARIAQLDDRDGEIRRELARVESEREEHARDPEKWGSVDPKLMRLDTAGERSLRDKLDEYADEQAKAARGVDIAKENAAASGAAYEALVEMDDSSVQAKRQGRTKGPLAALPGALAIAFALAGVPVFVHARAINSLSLTALGVGLVVFACLLAVMTVALVARPDRTAEAHDARLQDAQWVMLQDRKKLDASLAAKQLLDDDVAAFLDDAGLSAANGSIRQARALLDDAREARSDEQAFEQRTSSLDMRLVSIRQELGECADERRRLMLSIGFDELSEASQIEDEIELKKSQREVLSQTCDDMSVRIGELTERLESARTDRTFDLAKLRYQQTRVLLRDAKRELVTLMLAKRMLERSIIAWEGRNQPEVYRKASELFAAMTDNAWGQISITAEGRLVATAADGTSREARHLSLGTCQQLYLSLRVALLLRAENVGRDVPVLADDILVNFDAARRLGAARILAELAKKRQVIVFTCHRETVAALREAQPDLHYLEL